MNTESGAQDMLPLEGWARTLAKRWNSGAYTLFILHGNVFDLFPVLHEGRLTYVSLKAFLTKRLFPSRRIVMFYDIGEGLTFASAAMQQEFFSWLKVFDEVEGTSFSSQGLPRDFFRLSQVLRRFFATAADRPPLRGITLVISFAEKIVPATEESGATHEERVALVTLLNWATSQELRRADVGVFLVTETASELHPDLLQHPQVAQVRLDLPGLEERVQCLRADWVAELAKSSDPTSWSDLSVPELARRTAGLNVVRIRQVLAEAICNGERVTPLHLSATKKRLIEEFCQGLVRFKDPKPGVTMDQVATHRMAKKRLRELAWLITHEKASVLERGILIPGRVGVGKTFLIDCFASECGLPVLELGEFRSKWVGDTERQQARILMTIRALGPVIVVVDEADAVFGQRYTLGDSGVSSRVFAAFAAHIGDPSLRGRELWVAMTSRPDLLAIDMKRQGRFGACIPLFPAQGPDEVLELFEVIAAARQVALTQPVREYLRTSLGDRALTGSDVESMVNRAMERAILAGREGHVSVEDFQEAVDSFVDPLDPRLLELQELAAVLATSDRRYLPERYRHADRALLEAKFSALKAVVGP